MLSGDQLLQAVYLKFKEEKPASHCKEMTKDESPSIIFEDIQGTRICIVEEHSHAQIETE